MSLRKGTNKVQWEGRGETKLSKDIDPLGMRKSLLLSILCRATIKRVWSVEPL